MTPHRALTGAVLSGAAALVAACAAGGVRLSPPPAALAWLDADRVEAVAAGYRAGYAGIRANDVEKALKGLLAAHAINPRDDMLVYLIATQYANARDRKDALLWLDRLAALRSCFPPKESSFVAIADSDEYRAAEKRVRKALPRPGRAVVAFTVPERDLIPEGIAYDPEGRAFYLSSLYKRKIVRAVPGAPGAAAAVSDFTAEGQDGLDAVLGLRVDAQRRHLWAVSAAEPEMRGYRETDLGRSALFRYDLVTGKFLEKLVPPGPGPHLLNDLVVDTAGTAYATDSLSGEVLVARSGENGLEVLVPRGTFNAPNGIALSSDGRVLYVADFIEGVLRVDVATRKVTRLPQPPGLWPGALDGLYLHGNALVGILNVLNGGRVARFTLNEAGDAITRADVLECNNPHFALPTTGVLVENSLHFIANSQFGSYDGDGKLLTNELKDVVVLRLDLGP